MEKVIMFVLPSFPEIWYTLFDVGVCYFIYFLTITRKNTNAMNNSINMRMDLHKMKVLCFTSRPLFTSKHSNTDKYILQTKERKETRLDGRISETHRRRVSCILTYLNSVCNNLKLYLILENQVCIYNIKIHLKYKTISLGFYLLFFY